MMKHMKYAVLLIALVAMLMVGCGSTPTTTAPTAAVNEEPTEVATEAPTEMATEEPTEVMTEAPTEAATEEPTVEATQEVGPPTESEASEGTTGETLGTNEEFAGFGPILLGVINTVLEIDLETEEYTVFIPSTESAAELDTNAVMSLTEDPDAASAFAGCYVAEGAWTLDMFEDGATITMLNGDEYMITIDENGSIWLTAADEDDGARLANYTATANGVVYLLDGLLCTLESE